ncbi:hypothetical protein HMSSN036_49050 [Paenibacillus macerans]|nr:hypothetical protein HMSSN036_49050 [Paenibacillus macerans]
MYHAALIFAAAAGVIMFALLFAMAPYYAQASGVPESVVAIRALAPALLLFPLIAIIRGYLQGRNIMIAGGISQVIEQIVRVTTGIVLAFMLYNWGFSGKDIAAGATFGAVLGGVAALIVMLYFSVKMLRQDRTERAQDAKPEEKLPFKRIYAEISNCRSRSC